MDQHLIAFGKVFSDISQKGLSLFSPLFYSAHPFDAILVSPDGSLYRIKVQYRSIQREKLEVVLKDGHKNTLDLLAIYCPDTDKVYYVRSAEVNKSLVLRVGEAGKRSDSIKWAKDYENINRVFAEEFMFDILINGNPVRKYSKNAEFFVEALEGVAYEIAIQNNTSKRKMYVVSVDGLNVVTGEPAKMGGAGYVVEPYSRVVIDGWRKSLEEVSKFNFTLKENSYSELKGEGVDNTGVIGVAVFDEKPKLNLDYRTKGFITARGMGDTTLYSCSNTSGGILETMVSADSLAPQSMGTGWGDNKKSAATYAQFDAQDKPTYTHIIFYDSRENLIARGIIPTSKKPNPFPQETGFCLAP